MMADLSPAMRAVLDAVELVNDLLDELPEWRADAKLELTSRAQAVVELATGALIEGLAGGRTLAAGDPAETGESMKRIVDVDAIIQESRARIGPWTMSVQIAGESYAVRELTCGDLVQLEQVQEMGFSDLTAFVDGLFQERRPTSRLSHELIAACLAAVSAQVAERMQEQTRIMMRLTRGGVGGGAASDGKDGQ